MASPRGRGGAAKLQWQAILKGTVTALLPVGSWRPPDGCEQLGCTFALSPLGRSLRTSGGCVTSRTGKAGSGTSELQPCVSQGLRDAGLCSQGPLSAKSWAPHPDPCERRSLEKGRQWTRGFSACCLLSVHFPACTCEVRPEFGVQSSLLAEKAMAPHSSTLAWKIPWTEEPGRLQSMGLLRVGHD